MFILTHLGAFPDHLLLLKPTSQTRRETLTDFIDRTKMPIETRDFYTSAPHHVIDGTIDDGRTRSLSRLGAFFSVGNIDRTDPTLSTFTREKNVDVRLQSSIFDRNSVTVGDRSDF